MPILYLRHSEDSEGNSTFLHDAKLVNSGKRDSYKKAVHLVNKYGFPTKIYISPFERARETAIYFSKALKLIDPKKKVEFRIDPKLSRFFTKKDQKNPEMRDKTKRYNPPVYEEIDDLYSRINKQLLSMRERGYLNPNGKITIWCLTHALFCKKMLLISGLESPEHIPFLADYCIAEKDGKLILVK